MIPVPEIGLERGRHSHMIDLSTSLGADRIVDRWVPGKRIRYLDLQGVVTELEQQAKSTSDAQVGLLCKQIARIIGRIGARRDTSRKPVDGEMHVVTGIQAILTAMQGAESALEVWKLRDESREGLGFTLTPGRDFQKGNCWR